MLRQFILTNGHTGFQIDCGLRIQGNSNRIPQKSQKHSFRLMFKSKYGPGKLHYPVFPRQLRVNSTVLCFGLISITPGSTGTPEPARAPNAFGMPGSRIPSVPWAGPPDTPVLFTSFLMAFIGEFMILPNGRTPTSRPITSAENPRITM